MSLTEVLRTAVKGFLFSIGFICANALFSVLHWTHL